MKAVSRKVVASSDGKTLFITVNRKLLTVPWNASYFYQGETVLVSEEDGAYCVRPQNPHLRKSETHWKEFFDHGVSSKTV